jgi:TolB-like protein
VRGPRTPSPSTDTRLDRTVAIKVLPEHVAADPDLKQRFEREAKTISSLNHPHICTLHDIGSQDGVVYLVMEYLEGETVGERIQREALSPGEVVQHGLALLAALEALHGHGLLHRDLKPSNLFLTANGLKVIDFGLTRAQPTLSDETAETGLDLTHPGTLVGTPRFMAPEVLRGRPGSAQSDLFAVGALLYEALGGKPAFTGSSVFEIAEAVMHGNPRVLVGSPAVVAADRVVHRAMAKRPEDRYANAAEMAKDLRGVLKPSDVAVPAPGTAHQAPRLIALPFRMLRSDADAEFLTFSLPDAITTSLTGLTPLVVRSPLAGGDVSTDTPDLKQLAKDAEVDLVLLGTLLRAGDRLQVTAQLVEAPGGTVVWSHREQVAWQDIFQLQDDLTRRIVDSLATPLSAHERQQMQRDVPASAMAYEHYLRANQLADTASEWTIARDLYLRCVEEDPDYAPAWARLGRIHLVLRKYSTSGKEQDEGYGRAEQAFERALTLNPTLPVAHDLYTPLELEQGRSHQAMVRLLDRAKASPTDPHPFIGLVLACRYCGLLDASLEAHERAQRIDSHARTAVMFTLLHMGRYEDVIDGGQGLDAIAKVDGLMRLGRLNHAIEATREAERSPGIPAIAKKVFAFMRAVAEGDAAGIAASADRPRVELVRDPEFHFWYAGFAVRAGDLDWALWLLRRAVDGGFSCFTTMAEDPVLDPLRSDTEFIRILRLAETKQEAAAAAFANAGGNRILGL